MDMAISSAEIVMVVARLNAMNAMAMEGSVVIGAMEQEEMVYAFIVQVQTGKDECFSCNGRGYKECDECDGRGVLECDDCNGYGKLRCQECEGEGKVKVECSECDGEGKVSIFK